MTRASQPGRPLSIAGTGVVASVAAGTGPLFEALCAGRTGLAPLRSFDRGRFRTTVAYEIDDRPTAEDLPGRATRWLCEAIAEAVAHAGIGEDLSGVPVLVGTGLRELRSVELRWTTPRRPEPAGLPLSRLHFGPALRERFGAATTYTVTNACAASLYMLAIGADLVDSGAEDVVVVAGTDSITTSMFGLLDRVQPPAIDQVRPFDRDRRGALMGEGAAAVVLRRTGPARAWLRGISLNCDAYNETAPDAASILAAIANAQARAGVSAGEIDVVVAHGTGTVLNDATEAVALVKTFGGNGARPLVTGAFGGNGARPLVTGTKSMIGHTSGASGLVNVVVATEVLRTGRVPPIVGLREPTDEAQGLRLVTGTAVPAEVQLAQVNAFGFGGVNAVAILERAEQ